MNWYGYNSFLKQNNDESTAAAYIGDLEKFELFLSSVNTKCTDCDKKTITAFVKSLEEHGFADATRARILVSVRAFFAYLLKNGIVNKNPAESVSAPKVSKELPYIMSISEVDMLLSAPDDNNYRGIRDKAMLEIMYGTGIKVSELIGLNVSDIDFETGMLSCVSSRNVRMVPVGHFALNAVALYLDKARAFLIADKKETALFVNMSGKRISRQGFWKMLKEYAKQCSITNNITPNTLRHSFAQHLIARGASLKAVAQMLGHNDLSYTLKYLKAINKDTTRVYHELHPRA